MKRRIISMWMAIILLFTAVDLTAFAAEPTVSRNEIQSVSGDAVNGEKKTVDTVSPNETPTVSGQCGDNLFWSYENGTLTITGTGATWDYEGEGALQSPWYELREEITQLVLDDNITLLNVRFSECINLKGNVKIPSKMIAIMAYNFAGCTGLTSVEIPKGIQVIGEGAFASCKGITEITFKGAKPEFASNVFEGITANAYYPANDPTWEGIESAEGLGGNLTWVAVGEENDNPEIDEPKDEPEIDEPGNIIDGPDWGDIIEQDKQLYDDVSKVPDGMWIAGMKQEGYTYTGNNIVFTPGTSSEIRVYDGKILLKSNQDYTVSYKNNKKAYTLREGDAEYKASKAPTVTIKGKGNYSGSIVKTFVINPMDISKVKEDGTPIFDAPDILLGYNGRVQKGTTKVTYTDENGKVLSLKANTDFTYEYPGTSKEKSDYNENAFKEARLEPYVITIRGKGNYTGILTFKETITKNILLSKVKVSSIPAQKYDNGKELCPPVVLTDGKKTLSEYKDESQTGDYTIRYENNTLPGTGRVILEGKGGYAGTRVVTFKINGTELKKAKIEEFVSSYIYTGDAISQNDVKFTYQSGEETKTLELGKEYFAIYSKNESVGTATVKYEGNPKYGWTGTVKKTFKIKAYNVSTDENNCIVVTDTKGNSYPQDVKYQKSGAKPSVSVNYTSPKGKVYTLTEGKDYKVSYTNNKKLTEGTDEKKVPKIILTGKGNFTGKRQKETFKVVVSDISQLSITASDVVYQNKAGKFTTSVVVKDTDGKALKAGTDYEKTLKYYYDENVEKSGNEQHTAGEEVATTEIVPKGTKLRVEVTGKGNYAGKGEKAAVISGKYRVVEASLAKASVKVNKQYYTGKPVCPDKSQIVIKLNGKVISAKDYEIVSYENNVNKGNAKVTIEGTGKYGGRKTVTYTIANKPMDCIITFNANGATSGNMKEMKIKHGVTYTLLPNTYKRDGYEFVGWSTKSEGSVMDEQGKEIVYADKAQNPIQIGKEDMGRIIILYAQWKVKEYKITYNLNEGINHEQNPEYYTSEDEIEFKEPTREGYVFLGWYTDSSFSESKKITSISTGSKGDKVLYAKWRETFIDKVEMPEEYLNVIDFGASPDDETNDTNAFYKALNQAYINAGSGKANTVYVPAGIYIISPTSPYSGGSGIHMRSNTNLVMDNNAILYVEGTSSDSDCVIKAFMSKNITITGGQIQGERYRHTGKGGESAHGINFLGCSNITINNVYISSNWGDGIYLGTWYDSGAKIYTGTKDVVISHCEIIDNRRSNISIVDADNVLIDSCYIADAHGHAPQCGICIEPDKGECSGDQICSDITIRNTTITAYQNKNESGYWCFMTTANGSQSEQPADYVTGDRIRFENCTFNGYVGNYSGNNLSIDKKTVFNGKFVSWRDYTREK